MTNFSNNYINMKRPFQLLTSGLLALALLCPGLDANAQKSKPSAVQPEPGEHDYLPITQTTATAGETASETRPETTRETAPETKCETTGPNLVTSAPSATSARSPIRSKRETHIETPPAHA